MTERYIYENNSITDTIIKETIELTNYDDIIALLNQKENQLLHYEKRINELSDENEQLKKEYYQMRNLYFENAEDICDNCKHRYLVEVKDMQGYYHQKCKKGYGKCPKGTVTYCGDFELKGDVE